MKHSKQALTICTLLLLFAGVMVTSAAKPPRDDDPSAGGELYGDLYVLERDGNGEPILIDFTYIDPHSNSEVEVSCPQPLSGGCDLGDELGKLPYCAFVPLNVEKLDFDPEVEDACGPQIEFAGCLLEVSFGRGSVARSQPFVIDSAYAEFIKTINEAEYLDRDPSGRVMLGIVPEDGIGTVWKTIDAPLENLGLYREVMTNGCLGTVTDEVMGEGGVVTEVVYTLNKSAIDKMCGVTYNGESCMPDSDYASLLCEYPSYPDADWWLTPQIPDPMQVEDQDLLWATTFIAGATDKGDRLSLDEVVNTNTYLGINTFTFVKQKRDRILTVTYFDFGEFMYDQDSTFTSDTLAYLLTWTGGDSFIARDVFLFNDMEDGVALGEVAVPICREGVVRQDQAYDLICDSSLDEPYDPDSLDFGCGGANWFTQAAEHARKTIWFVHNWSVPEIAD